MISWKTPKRFVVKDYHMKLLDRLWFDFHDDIEFGAPAVDPKRPYGNSDVYDDIAEITGIEGETDEWGNKDFSPEQIKFMDMIHREMTTVLQILVANAATGISPGMYQTSTQYGIDWKRA